MHSLPVLEDCLIAKPCNSRQEQGHPVSLSEAGTYDSNLFMLLQGKESSQEHWQRGIIQTNEASLLVCFFKTQLFLPVCLRSV